MTAYIDEQLFKNLPQEERERFNHDDTPIEEFIHKIRSEADPYFWSKERLPEISRLSLLAFFQNKMSWQEMASIHLLIEAWLEYMYEPNFTTILLVKEETVTYNFSPSEPDQKIINEAICTPFYFRRLPYNASSILDGNMRPTTKTKACLEVEVLYGKEEGAPFLKKYFCLDDQEWNLFQTFCETTQEEEQIFYYMEAPIFGTISPYLEFHKAFADLYQPVRVYKENKEGTNHIPQLAFLIPSFSLFQNFLATKAYFIKREPYQLIPQFGLTPEEAIAELVNKGQAPVGLYYPLSKHLNNHTRELEGFPSHGLSFSLHDIDHARFDMLYKYFKETHENVSL